MTIQLIIKSCDCKTYVVEIEQDATIHELMQKIQKFNKVPVEQQYLTIGLSYITDTEEKTLKDYNIQDFSTIQAHFRLRVSNVSCADSDAHKNL